MAEQLSMATQPITATQEHSEDTQDSESESLLEVKVGSTNGTLTNIHEQQSTISQGSSTNSFPILDSSLLEEDEQLRSLYDRKIEIEKRLVELNKDLQRITSKLEKHQSSSNTHSSNGGGGKAGRKRKLPPVPSEPVPKKPKSTTTTSNTTGGGNRKSTSKKTSKQNATAVARPQRTRRKSCILREAEGTEVQLSQGLASCISVMRYIMSHRWAGPFNSPVDYVTLGIPDYPDIIKHPMDFGTVKSKLESGQYEDVTDFCADMNLVFSNATTYNRPGSDVHIMAQTIQECFKKKMRPIENREQLRERKAQMAEDGGITELKKSVDSIRQELQILLKTQSQSPPTNSKRTAAGASTLSNSLPVLKNAEDIPMTKEEMKRLSSAINSLPYVHLSAIVKIIGQKMPHLANQKECDINITILDNPTLRKLETYVHSVKRKKNSRSQQAIPVPLSPVPVATPVLIQPANGQGGKSLADQSLMNPNPDDSESGSESDSESGSSSDSGSESSSDDGNESDPESERSGGESEKDEDGDA